MRSFFNTKDKIRDINVDSFYFGLCFGLNFNRIFGFELDSQNSNLNLFQSKLSYPSSTFQVLYLSMNGT